MEATASRPCTLPIPHLLPSLTTPPHPPTAFTPAEERTPSTATQPRRRRLLRLGRCTRCPVRTRLLKSMRADMMLSRECMAASVAESMVDTAVGISTTIPLLEVPAPSIGRGSRASLPCKTCPQTWTIIHRTYNTIHHHHRPYRRPFLFLSSPPFHPLAFLSFHLPRLIRLHDSPFSFLSLGLGTVLCSLSRPPRVFYRC